MPEASGRNTTSTDDLLTLFDVMRQDVRTFGRSPAFLAYTQSTEFPSVGPLILLILKHVPSARFLPLSFLMEELNTLNAEIKE